ncbi:MAG: DUF4105 domain-containing protein [Bdellovibrionales bacterium]|nr:DUF4105 domain-containing protein [Bdellovibrionales bacterium]
MIASLKFFFYFLAIFLLVGIFIIFWLRKPLLYSNWDKDVRVLAKVTFLEDQSSFVLKDIRNWSYDESGPLDESVYFEQAFELKDLEKVWFYVQPLEASGLIAHTFLVFEFNESYGAAQRLGLSIETRRRVGEQYSLLKGALRGFMLTHIWATERDLTSRRTDYLGYTLQKYQLNLAKDQIRKIIIGFLNETNSLHTTPRFYNTLTYNCTSALAHYINQTIPGSIPWHYSFIFTGKSAEYLTRLGYISEAAVG